MPAVVGRDPELARLDPFITSVDGARALILEGEAGMGKTTLWRAGVELAAEHGIRVLRALPAESEIALSFSGLGDLLDGVLDAALAPLPAAQASALSRALVLDEKGGPAPDPHAVGIALLHALRGLAADRSLVLAIDDVQWLDTASTGTLAYAARRLRDEPVAILLSRRSGLGARSSTSCAGRSRGRASTSSKWVRSGLRCSTTSYWSRSASSCRARSSSRSIRPAGGNPFYALEIVRMLQRSDASIEAGQPIPVPESLHDLVQGRLLTLPPESRDFLLAAAAHAHPTIAITEAASGVSRKEGPTPALDARVVELDRQRIRFTHPLLAAGAYRHRRPDPPPRGCHASLAELLEDPEARAWQLAASVEQPGEDVALVLEEAAQHARARGAPAASSPPTRPCPRAHARLTRGCGVEARG